MAISDHTWAVSEIVTAANMNTYLRDNMSDLQTNKLVIETGSYTGDGTTDQTVSLTNTSLAVKYLIIHVVGGDGGNVASWWTHESIVDLLVGGYSLYQIGGTFQGKNNQIIALGTGEFHVDDAGTDSHPNTNSTTYYYIAIGSG